jgi:hypothetical protein
MPGRQPRCDTLSYELAKDAFYLSGHGTVYARVLAAREDLPE